MIHASEKAAFKVPPLSADTHFHVFGPADRYPVQHRDRYEAPSAPLAEYLKLAEAIGFERLVFVQPSAYGTDNRCMLDAMAVLAPTRAVRGLVDVAEDCPDAELTELHRQGVRGVRINTSPYAKPDANRVAELRPRIEMLAARTAGAGWCLEFLSPGWLTEALMPTMRALKLPFILDHIGLFQAEAGVDQPGFRDLIRLVEGGNCWIKLTGAYRISKRPDFSDIRPMVQALAKVAPDRLIWGSDYPHLRFGHISSTAMFNLLADWLPEDALRRKVLADNPAALFGFGAADGKIDYRRLPVAAE